MFLYVFATKLPGGYPIRNPKFGARLLWHRYVRKYLIRLISIHIFLYNFAVKLPGATLFGARNSGPNSCKTDMSKHI